jgi:peptidoglycan/xylan/chitin deacetylase (PgdA/CDA1 family)
MAPRRAIVVMFHTIHVGHPDATRAPRGEPDFEHVLNFIGRHFECVPLGEIVDRLRTGRSIKGLAALTFDDGYIDWLPSVCPILERRRWPATFFVTTSQLEGVPLWSERIAHFIRHGAPASFEDIESALPAIQWETTEAREESIERFTHALKYLKVDLRDSLIKRMEQRCGVEPNSIPRFSRDDLLGIANKGFEIGSHTVDHPILTCCDEDEAFRQIAESRARLSDITGKEVRLFAYPNGKPVTDFTHRDVELVIRAGYSGAVTSASGAISAQCPPMLIPRFSLWPTPRASLSRQMAGQLRRLASRELIEQP